MEITVNAAMSADGKLSTVERRQVTISGPEDFSRVDKLRATSDAIMVGIGTVLADDPRLGIDSKQHIMERESNGKPDQPTRIVVDSTGATPSDARILDDTAPSVVLASDRLAESEQDRLERTGANVVKAGGSTVDLASALDELAEEGIGRVMVEGGGELIYGCFEAGIVDSLSVYIGNRIIGGRTAPTLADGEGFVDPETFPELELECVDRLDLGVLLSWNVV